MLTAPDWCCLHHTGSAEVLCHLWQSPLLQNSESAPLGFTPARTTDTLSKPAAGQPAAFHRLLCLRASQWPSGKQQGSIFLCLPRWAVAVDVLIFCLWAVRKNLKHFTSEFSASSQLHFWTCACTCTGPMGKNCRSQCNCRTARCLAVGCCRDASCVSISRRFLKRVKEIKEELFLISNEFTDLLKTPAC